MLPTDNSAPSGMVLLRGGSFRMGSDDSDYPPDGEGPVRPVEVSRFWMDATAVSNDSFGQFVAETGHVTDAERFGWSFVFESFVAKLVLHHAKRMPGVRWWVAVPGAAWHRPAGPDSSVAALGDHPVVHVSWRDCVAYADWIGRRLPTEAEWEYAARGGLEGKRYPWGDDFPVGKSARANIFEGTFPGENSAADGYEGTAPVGAYEPNGFGLHNMVGNVWEWTADWWGTKHSAAEAVDPVGPQMGVSRVIRGGSYLCHDSYCNRYRVSARTSNTPESTTGHTGFRLARDA